MIPTYEADRWQSVYNSDFVMPEGEELAVVESDDAGNAILPAGTVQDCPMMFHCGADGFRVRIIRAKNRKDAGLWAFGNRGGRLFV